MDLTIGNAHFLSQKMAQTDGRVRLFPRMRYYTHYEGGGASNGGTTCIYNDFKGQCLSSNFNALVDEYEKWQFIIIDAWP